MLIPSICEKKYYLEYPVSLFWTECYFCCYGVIAFLFFFLCSIIVHVNQHRELVWETCNSVLCELPNTQLRKSNHCILKYHCLVALPFSALNCG